MMQSSNVLNYLFLITIIQLSLSCDPNCASCRQTNQTGQGGCLACKSGFSPTQNDNCIAENTIQNCATYDQSSNCISCRPTFQNIWNICQRMFDGCLFYKNGKCTQCLHGGILNTVTGGCMVQYLNCIKIDNLGACVSCQPRYTLTNGKCIYQSNCSFTDKNTGMCTQCTPRWVYIGTTCLPPQRVVENCYLVDDSQLNFTCRYCKQGYGVFNGLCLTFTNIINSTTQNLTSPCNTPQYLENNQISCMSLSSNCLTADLGSLNCVYCQSDFILVNNTCIFMANNFCLTLNGTICLQCKPGFFLRNGQCNPFPANCINFTFTCTQCLPNFQLINGNCVDPNCQTVNPITRACQICVVNFRLNPIGVCRFIDPNCQQFNTNGDCLKCLSGYSVRATLQYCVYQDVNCLRFDNATGNCNMCKPFFSYNSQVQLCVPLPDYCLTGDSFGRCNSCMTGYSLISNYNCLFVLPLPNCRVISSKDNYTKCFICNNGTYADSDGVCRPLPAFCGVYDNVNSQCQQCSDNGLMRNGACVDKNCQIFDLQGGCLACITSFQFNSFGQCTFTPKDPNCKNFTFGICQLCIERFYFNFQFVCTAVSPLCKTYDLNSGFCLSCYGGYELNDNGACIVNFYNSIFGTMDLLSSECKTQNKLRECIECYPGYQAKPLSNSTKAVKCVQAENSYCIDLDSVTGRCQQCVTRMFVNRTGGCQNIDQNCDTYNRTSGACISCYSGYQVKFIAQKNITSCIIETDNDAVVTPKDYNITQNQ